MANGYRTNISTKSYRGILCMYLWYYRGKFGGCRQIPTQEKVSGSKLCRRDRGIWEKCDDIWLLGRHVADMSATFSAKVCRWCAALQDTTIPQGCNIVRNHRGPAGYLDDIQEELIAFVTDWRDRGMPVTHFALVRKIGQLKPEFLEKTSNARLMCVSHFFVLNNLVHRVATHGSALSR